jgi:hypothetical protein
MQGWGSLAGVFTSLVAIIFTGLLLRHEIRARRRDEEESAAAQARLIKVRVDSETRKKLDSPGVVVTRLSFRVANHSEQAIFTIFVKPIPDFLNLHFRAIGGIQNPADSNFRSDVLEPGGIFEGAWTVEHRADRVDGLFLGADGSFTDRAGLRWSIGTPPLGKMERLRPFVEHGVVAAYLLLISNKPPFIWLRSWHTGMRYRANLRLNRQRSRPPKSHWPETLDKDGSTVEPDHDNGHGHIPTR